MASLDSQEKYRQEIEMIDSTITDIIAKIDACKELMTAQPTYADLILRNVEAIKEIVQHLGLPEPDL